MSLVSVFKMLSVYWGNKKTYQCLRHGVVRALEALEAVLQGLEDSAAQAQGC